MIEHGNIYAKAGDRKTSWFSTLLECQECAIYYIVQMCALASEGKDVCRRKKLQHVCCTQREYMTVCDTGYSISTLYFAPSARVIVVTPQKDILINACVVFI